ncbi:MAG: ParB/RepB/Spo0J family partition protein [Clostridia bacterium]|nr:ParB/RepB/Spo0J family partition protein [Clostridia bacterium]
MMEQKMAASGMIPPDEIRISDRIRRDNGDIDSLTESIREHGLINPITVMETSDGGYVLIAGLRRLEAVRRLRQDTISATVLSPLEADEALMLEYAENEERKPFTVTERLAYAERIKAIEKEKAKQRMKAGRKVDEADPTGKCPEGMEKGEAREIVARKAGFSSEKQMRRAEKLANRRPDLVERVDRGEMTIGRAETIMKNEVAQKHSVENHEQPEIVDVVVEEQPVVVETYQAFKPHMMKAPGSVKTIRGADHDHLMENPIYRQLFASYNDAVQQVNLARGEMRSRCEGYERQIRALKENIFALHNENVRLRGDHHA